MSLKLENLPLEVQVLAEIARCTEGVLWRTGGTTMVIEGRPILSKDWTRILWLLRAQGLLISERDRARSVEQFKPGQKTITVYKLSPEGKALLKELGV